MPKRTEPPTCASLLRNLATDEVFTCGAPATLTDWFGEPLCLSCRTKANEIVDAIPRALDEKWAAFKQERDAVVD